MLPQTLTSFFSMIFFILFLDIHNVVKYVMLQKRSIIGTEWMKQRNEKVSKTLINFIHEYHVTYIKRSKQHQFVSWLLFCFLFFFNFLLLFLTYVLQFFRQRQVFVHWYISWKNQLLGSALPVHWFLMLLYLWSFLYPTWDTMELCRCIIYVNYSCH